jgi:hypothetical protein
MTQSLGERNEVRGKELIEDIFMLRGAPKGHGGLTRE